MTKTHVSEVPPFHIHRTHIYTHTHNIFVAVVVIASPLQMCLAGTKFMIYALQYYYIHIHIIRYVVVCGGQASGIWSTYTNNGAFSVRRRRQCLPLYERVE